MGGFGLRFTMVNACSLWVESALRLGYVGCCFRVYSFESRAWVTVQGNSHEDDGTTRYECYLWHDFASSLSRSDLRMERPSIRVIWGIPVQYLVLLWRRLLFP